MATLKNHSPIERGMYTYDVHIVHTYTPHDDVMSTSLKSLFSSFGETSELNQEVSFVRTRAKIMMAGQKCRLRRHPFLPTKIPVFASYSTFPCRLLHRNVVTEVSSIW